ncbi:MAG: trimethylamine methyltransferase family protein [Anaerolineales bacterium]
MIIRNNSAFQTPQFRVLSDDQCELIYLNALEVLQRVGVLIHNPQARQILHDFGCHVDGENVKIPAYLVQKALITTPRTFTIFGKRSEYDIRIEANRVHFGPGPTCTYFIDPQTWKRRRSKKGDAALVAKVCDGLENMDFLMSLSVFDDVAADLSPLYEFSEMITNSHKPVIAWSTKAEVLEEIYKVACVVAGTEQNFVKRPNFAFFGTYESPLGLADGQIGSMLWAAEHGIPLICLGGPTVGLESPPTGASALVLYLASSLSALTVIQLHQPGSAMMIGAALGAMDLRTARPAYGSPEMSLYTAAAMDIAKFLGIPFMGTAGASESKQVDSQAASEIALQIMLSALSGASLVHDVGFLDCADIGSLELLILADEVIGMTKRIMRGIDVNPQTIMLDLIENVGPGQHFLSQPKAVSLCKKEIWIPQIFDRNAYVIWEKNGAKSIHERIQSRLTSILENHSAPILPKGSAEKIVEILNQAEERFRK